MVPQYPNYYQPYPYPYYPQTPPPSPQLPPVTMFDKVVRIIKYVLPYAVPIIIFVLVAFTGIPLGFF